MTVSSSETTHKPNPDEEGEGDIVLKTPETIARDRWGSSLQVDSQPMTSRTQKQVTSFFSDDDPVHLEEEVCRKYLLQTPIKVHVEVCVDVATSEKSPSSDQGFVITSTVSSHFVSQSPDL